MKSGNKIGMGIVDKGMHLKYTNAGMINASRVVMGIRHVQERETTKIGPSCWLSHTSEVLSYTIMLS